ncbi:MAG: ferrochelatase [bacterium]|nr:ferrochelatase [bacterium]
MTTSRTGSTPPVGVLIAQLGTPQAPTAKALRPYLREFLSDRRVIDLHPLKWLPILYLFILTRRPARSARLYQRIWTDEGSPLLLYSRAQESGVQARLGDGFRVIVGMRYGKPGIDAAMAQFAAEGIERIVVLPMFPQFSCSTTGSIYDGVTRAAFGRRCPLFFDRRRQMPTLRFVPPYYDHPEYIESLKVIVEEQVQTLKRAPDRYLITFHGIPLRYVEEGDPYRDQCLRTGQLLADALALQPEQWVQGFQSRFGKEEWLQPYTEDVLAELPGQGVRSLVATCPGFTADCLETLDEIGTEGGEIFRHAGGEQLHLAPCLNAHPRWLDAMASIIRSEAAGWQTDGA